MMKIRKLSENLNQSDLSTKTEVSNTTPDENLKNLNLSQLSLIMLKMMKTM